MKQYLDMVQHVLDNGEETDDRTGVGTISVFGYQNRYDLRDGFPILTTKKTNFGKIKSELLWFLNGQTNINELKEIHKENSIWDEWADDDGNLGPIYGQQWRSWEVPIRDGKREYVDQIQTVIHQIKNNPTSRRLIVSAWNVADVPRMKLPCCHILFQFKAINGFLDLQLYQRSADLALGVPFNISSYCLLLSIIANECNLIPRYFVHTFGDLHIYKNHIEGIQLQLTRTPKKLPTLQIADKPLIDMNGDCNFTMDDAGLIGYECDPWIKFKVAV